MNHISVDQPFNPIYIVDIIVMLPAGKLEYIGIFAWQLSKGLI